MTIRIDSSVVVSITDKNGYLLNRMQVAEFRVRAFSEVELARQIKETIEHRFETVVLD